LAKPENHGHFSGPENVERVRAWRKAHPGYWRETAKRRNALQDVKSAQAVDEKGDSAVLTCDALQDVLSAQQALLVGVISSLTGSALQDEIAQTMRMFETRGAMILGNVPRPQKQ